MNYLKHVLTKMAANNAANIQNISRPGGSQTIQNVDPYWFSALRPVAPTAPASYRPRQWPYLPGFNVVWQPRGEDSGRIPFEILQEAHEQWELWRAALKTVIDRVATLEWQIRARTDPGAPTSQVPKQADPIAQKLTAVFNSPDGIHNTEQWFRMILKDMYVFDAASIYCELATDGKGLMPKSPIKAFMPLDGTTIKVLVDDMGRRPQGINPETGEKDAAYQQVVYGLPAIDFTEDDLIYAVQNPHNKSAYGVSYLEDILIWANIGIRSQQFLLNYYTNGNTPEMIVGVDPTTPAQKIEEWNEMLDSYLSGNLAERRKIKMLPALGSDGKLNAIFPKEPLLKNELDEWMARIVCFTLGLNPQAFVRSMNRATAEQQQDTAEQEGQMPVIHWLENTVNECIRRLGYGDDYEFTFRVRREQDGKKQMDIDTGYLKMGVYTVNMVLADLGLDQLDEPFADKHFAWTPNGPVPLDMIADGEMLSQPGGATVQPEAPSQPTAEAPEDNKPTEDAKPPEGKKKPSVKKKMRSDTKHIEDSLNAKLQNKFKVSRNEAIAALREIIASRKKDA